jgi:hypothetical protein
MKKGGTFSLDIEGTSLAITDVQLPEIVDAEGQPITRESLRDMYHLAIGGTGRIASRGLSGYDDVHSGRASHWYSRAGQPSYDLSTIAADYSALEERVVANYGVQAEQVALAMAQIGASLEHYIGRVIDSSLFADMEATLDDLMFGEGRRERIRDMATVNITPHREFGEHPAVIDPPSEPRTGTAVYRKPGPGVSRNPFHREDHRHSARDNRRARK